MTISDAQGSGAGYQSLSTTVSWQGRAAVVAVTGEVDMVTAPKLHQVLSEVLGQHPDTLVADLTAVGFLASAGLSTLVTAYREAGDRTSLRVVATNSATVRPLQVTALDRNIRVFTTVEDAIGDS